MQASRDVLRAASEVACIASALESDLGRLQGDPKAQAYGLRCARLRERADIALADPARVRQLTFRRLVRAGSRFRSDLQKLKQFRQEVQVEVLFHEYACRVRSLEALNNAANDAFLHGDLLASS